MSQQSFHQQTATGADINFTITTFSSDELKVYVDGVLKSAGSDYNINPYNTSGQSTVDWIGTAPTSPSIVRVIRQTDVMNNGNTAVEGKATFQAGSSVKAGDLNNNTKQALRAIKEQQDQKIQSYDIEPNAILTAAIKDDAVTMDKIADGSLPTGVTVASANIVDGTIVNADINASAAIAGTKISPNFGTQVISTTGNITVGGTVDGRDIANDGTKLDSIETGATADQTNAEIKTAYEANADTNAFQDAEKTKLAGIETAATADQTAAEIRSLVESASDSNVFTDADHSKLNGIEAGATADQTAAEIKTLYESISDTNEFSDAEKTKLAGIEAGATADQTNAEIKTAYEANANTNEFSDAEQSKLAGIEAGATADQTNAEIKTAYEANADTNEFSDAEQSKLAGIETAATADQTSGEIKTLLQSDKLTLSEINTTSLDSRYFTETEADARYFRQDSSETITSGDTWTSSDGFVATTGAIDLRVIELVDDVGGFVPIANETSFPTSNPDINNPATGGTIVSVKAASTALTAQSGTTLTIANGRGTGNAVIITGVTATIPQGFGFLVETTSTDHTYAFHRLVPVATQVATVANNITNIVNAGANVADISNFADLYQISASAPTTRADSSSLQVGDLWFDSSSNKVLMIYDGSSGDGFSAATPNQSDLTNIGIVAGQLVFSEDLGSITNAVNTGSGNNSLNTVATDITNVNTVAGSIANVNAVAADATDIGAVAGKATEIGRLGTADAVADLAILGTTDVVSDLNTLATSAIVSDMDTLADISSNITTVAGISSNVTSVAGNNTNITAVANNSTNINAVQANASNINAVAGNATNINAVAADATDIGAVAGKATEIGRLGTADAVADLAILGTNAIVSDMDTLADISSNITTVAGISSNVTSVAGNASNINSAVSNASNINAAVSNASNINTVAGNNTNINTVAGVSSNITTVAGIASNVTSVANDAADIGAVAGKATEIGRLGTADAVADLAILGTTDVVSDMNTLATSANVTAMDNCSDDIANINTVSGSIANVNTTAGSIANVNTTASNISNVNTVAGISSNVTTVAGNNSNVTTVAGSINNVNTTASNIASVNNFAATYQIASSAPSTDGAGNALAAGDLYFDTSANELRVHNGSTFQGGVTATGNLAGLGANTFTGNQTVNANIIVSGTVDGRDVAADGTKLDGIEASATADQTAAEIRTLVESASDSNVFTDADHTKLNGIESNATADQTAAEIRTLVESASNSNVFTDADHSKLNGIEASATADQTASEIVALISGQTIAPNVITTTNLTLDFGSIA